jgi:hypothetical protein
MHGRFPYEIECFSLGTFLSENVLRENLIKTEQGFQGAFELDRRGAKHVIAIDRACLTRTLSGQPIQSMHLGYI